MSQIVNLDIGGKIFKTTKTTLCSVDGFFSRMCSSDWNEVVSLKDHSIFVDRDGEVFPLILSYLRSQKLCVDEVNTSDVYLQKALLEADFYALTDLSEMIAEELSNRYKKNVNVKNSKEVFKSVPLADVNSFFERGWAFVGCYKSDDTHACFKTGKNIYATIRDSRCTACGDRIDYTKFSDHFVNIQPTIAIIKREDPSGKNNSENLVEALPNTLLFDASFG